MKEVIILGGGKSIREGISLNLWNKIRDKNVWSLNYAFLTLPFLPKRELFVDRGFYKNNVDALQALSDQGVEMVARYQDTYAAIDKIRKYQTTKEVNGYQGKRALKTDSTPHIYVGQLGLVGTFALSLAIAEGYDTIWLLGFDFGVQSYEDKDTHFYQGQIKVISSGVGNPQIYLNPDNSTKIVENDKGEKIDLIKDYEVFAQEKNIHIYNVSPNSRLSYFQKISYQEFFNKIGGNDVHL